MAARVLSVLALLMALATPPAVWSAPANAPSAATTQPKIPPAPAAKAPPPESIPVPEVARRAEEVGKVLRDFDALLVPGPAIEVIDKQLPEIAARIAVETEGTGRQLEPQPAGATLDGLTAQWQTARAGLVGYVNVLAGRATTLEAALDRLTGLRETWTRTRADARASRAPAQVIQRIDSVLTAVAASRTRLEGQRAATLVLQDRAAQEVARCEGMLGRIAALRQGVAEGLLEQDGAPLWHTEQLARAVSELPERVRSAVAADAAQLRQFVRDQRWRILLPVALFIGLALLMRGARRKADL